MKYLFLTILLFLTFTNYSSASRYVLKIDECLHEKAFEIAEGEVGVVEKTGRNDGEVEKYLRVVGLGKGYPYCAAGISWCYLEAAKFYGKTKSFIPFPMTAGSQVVYSHAKKYGVKGKNKPEKGDFFTYRKKNSYTGHTGIVDTVKKAGWIESIEFNTSSGIGGSQRDGGGVYRRKRNYLHPLGRMMFRGFVGFDKQKSDLCKDPVLITEATIYKSHSISKRDRKDETFIDKIYKFFIK
jgi:hypothetical protein